MSESRFAGIGAELKAKKKAGKRATVQPSERLDEATEQRIDETTPERSNVETTTPPNEGGRKPGKRKSGFVQIAGLIPPDTRDGLNIALAFETRDLSEVLTDLLNDWLESQPAHVRAAIEAKRGK